MNSSIHTIMLLSFHPDFLDKSTCDWPNFIFLSVSNPCAEGLIEVGWWWAIYPTIAATVWVVFSILHVGLRLTGKENWANHT